ncbi:WD repeat domain-containing protein [Phlyctema vagabunda]|uniref:WD repeat domain-containing protein n=1 Tax=Phlyctema vagabunda TaxID=108571 RepID=A0ABR4PRT4_9HELO
MERNEGIIRWSPNPARDEFLTVNLNFRIIQVYEATGHARPGQFDYEKTSKHNEFPSLTAYDWSPKVNGLVAVGTGSGQVHLLRVDDNSNTALTLPLKLQRSCHAVAFNTDGLLAVGLDRVRNDMCLQIWDINQRLSGWNPASSGWATAGKDPAEPIHKLEPSVAISSIRFFEDQPKTLAIGIKNQNVRIHDLRDPSSSVMTFQTRCNNNLAIDYADTNYFASSTLDQPGLVVWDRRAVGRPVASPMYLESVDNNEVSWGGALKLDRAIDKEKNAYIRGLRYCRDQRGTLGILSSTGQLQVMQINKEFIDPESKSFGVTGSPELLEVNRSYDIEYPYSNENYGGRYDERIISFDWLALGNSALQSRVVALRANGKIEILQKPAATSDQLGKLVPWVPPHRLDEPLSLIKFADPTEGAVVYSPLFTAEVNKDLPLFGKEKLTGDNLASHLTPELYHQIKSATDIVIDLNAPQKSQSSLGSSEPMTDDKRVLAFRKNSKLRLASDLPMAQNYSDNLAEVLLKRAKDGYLFDCARNRSIISHDPSLQNAWEWVAGAEEAAKDDGMVSMSLDLSYMGVHTIWMNNLGEASHSRLIESSIIPNTDEWERLIGLINTNVAMTDYKLGVETTRRQHRNLCLTINGWGLASADFDADLEALENEGKHTQAATWAMIEGVPKRAIGILQRAGSDMLFVAMALEIKLQTSNNVDLGSDWVQAIARSPQMKKDPYLRAISGFISTGDWTTVVGEQSLPLRARIGVALRHLDDNQLTDWLNEELGKSMKSGDLAGIVLSGITDNLVDILTKYIEKTGDFQTATLMLSFCSPRYIDDIRCAGLRKEYQAFLQRHKEFILRVRFEQGSTKMSRLRDGTPLIKPPPRQVTIRCLKCDSQAANDLNNSGSGVHSTSGPSITTVDSRNPLMATGINAGLSCPKCGSHLGRCTSCLQIVGQPRSDRPEVSLDPGVRRMAKFPSWCLKCNHLMHMDCSVSWFAKHVECPVAECRCQCNYEAAQRGDRA